LVVVVLAQRLDAEVRRAGRPVRARDDGNYAKTDLPTN
jgi:hypothetical protein